MSTIENIVKSLAYATEHNQGLHLTHEEVPALNARIAELEGFINQLIEAGELLAEYCDYETGKIAWDALVKDWKEREE